MSPLLAHECPASHCDQTDRFVPAYLEHDRVRDQETPCEGACTTSAHFRGAGKPQLLGWHQDALTRHVNCHSHGWLLQARGHGHSPGPLHLAPFHSALPLGTHRQQQAAVHCPTQQLGQVALNPGGPHAETLTDPGLQMLAGTPTSTPADPS